jgi:outer membrane biosynthesis protein TonB
VSRGDQLVERGATRLQELADRAAARGDGIGEWLSEELRNDAAFLRKLKPSLVKARAQANSQGSTEPEPPAPPPPPQATEAPPAAAPPVEGPAAETQPMIARPKPKPKAKAKVKAKPKGKRGGPPPVVIVGAALVAGILLAKFVDWRGHAHPKD